MFFDNIFSVALKKQIYIEIQILPTFWIIWLNTWQFMWNFDHYCNKNCKILWNISYMCYFAHFKINNVLVVLQVINIFYDKYYSFTN